MLCDEHADTKVHERPTTIAKPHVETSLVGLGPSPSSAGENRIIPRLMVAEAKCTKLWTTVADLLSSSASKTATPCMTSF
jgi:hypothetical protein